MHILIDIGNSTIVAAMADKEGSIAHTWRFKTRKEETVTFFRYELKQGLRKYGVEAADIESVTISSVVPEVNDDISQAVNDLTGLTPHFFTLDEAQSFLTIDIESPSQLGKDRLADALGAVTCYGVPAIVIDFGTATTFGVIDAERRFLGGLIIPGVKTSLSALSQRASQLSAINIEKPQHLVGRNTLECMQSGILYGTVAMIDGLIDRLLPTLSEPVHIIATGGMAKDIVPHCHHQIELDKHLLLKGLFNATHPK
jgi:type III pantothenate kinase